MDDNVKEEMELSQATNELMPVMRFVRAFLKTDNVLRVATIVNATLHTKEKKVEELTGEIASLEEKKAGLESAVGVLESKEAQELETLIKTLRSDLGEVTSKLDAKLQEEQQLTEKLVTLRAEVSRIATRFSNVI